MVPAHASILISGKSLKNIYRQERSYIISVQESILERSSSKDLNQSNSQIKYSMNDWETVQLVIVSLISILVFHFTALAKAVSLKLRQERAGLGQAAAEEAYCTTY